MKLRTKLKRLNAENERLKNTAIEPRYVDHTANMRIRKLVRTTSVHNANLECDYAWVDGTTRGILARELTDEVESLVKITTKPDPLSGDHTLYRAELYVYVEEEKK